MTYRELCAGGPLVSEIGLGTWALGSPVYGKVEHTAADAVVGTALDEGINFFDTAPLYGTTEEDGIAETLLGKALGSRRDSVLISTKFGRTARAVMPGRFTASEARESCESSLRRLRSDHIDVLFFHSPFNPGEIADDVWEALGALQESGKIRHIGHSVSMYSDTAEMSAAWMRERRIAVVQVVLSPFNREARPLIETARVTGCGVIARECLANGFLSGMVRADTIFPEGSLNARYSREEVAERVAYAERLGELFAEEGVGGLVEGTYRWILDQDGVSAALSGAKSPAELAASVRASALPSFSRALLESTEAVHAKDFGAA
jgi:aryl-alcohol dehydrogenase-like predicted oxidoreductase